MEPACTSQDEAYVFGRVRVTDPDPEHRSLSLGRLIDDPGGNCWILQEITTRLSGRVAPNTTYASTADLVQALRRAAFEVKLVQMEGCC